MKIYRHKTNPAIVGVKFEDIRRTMVQIEADDTVERLIAHLNTVY